jgi:hypothetical protein
VDVISLHLMINKSRMVNEVSSMCIMQPTHLVSLGFFEGLQFNGTTSKLTCGRKVMHGFFTFIFLMERIKLRALRME